MNTLKIDLNALEAARKQFCLDIGMNWEEYVKDPCRKTYIKKTVDSGKDLETRMPGARNYEGRDTFFHAMICLGQLFLVVDERIYDWAVQEFADCAPEWFCAFQNLRKIEKKLEEYGHTIKDTHVYFLPERTEEPVQDVTARVSGKDWSRITGEDWEKNDNDKEVLKVPEMINWYDREEILGFQENNLFTSAICFSKTQPDMLAVASLRSHNAEENQDMSGKTKCFDQSQMAGMAGVSADGAYLWQIGINVLPEETGRGLAAGLVRLLKEEVQRKGKIPFYGTSESHTVSQTVGLKAGFVPAWTEVYSGPLRVG